MIMISVIRSGMSAALSDLDVTSNNIANAATTGYKKREASFTDVYADTVADQRWQKGWVWCSDTRNTI
jgi:flagellar hook protein FlgE